MSTKTETRQVRVQAGDSLRLIARRELGSVLRWAELIDLNALRPPYIVASLDPAERLPGTLIWGDAIRVPVGTVVDVPHNLPSLLGIDVQLTAGAIEVNDDGDWELTAGTDNLSQALGHRLQTPSGGLPAHPTYGCPLTDVVGLPNNHVVALMATGFIKVSIQEDPRVARLDGVRVQVVGDQLQAAVRAVTVATNTPLDLNLVFPITG